MESAGRRMQRQKGVTPTPPANAAPPTAGCSRGVKAHASQNDVAHEAGEGTGVAGKRPARLDTVDKPPADRSTAWTKLPGMLNAAMTDCPIFGGKVKSYDEAAAMKRPGVKKGRACR